MNFDPKERMWPLCILVYTFVFILVQDDDPPILEDSSTLPSDPAPEYTAEPPSKLDEVQPPPSTEEVVPGTEEDFPVQSLNALDEQLNRPKWVVPVRPGDELERLLKASIKLCREGVLQLSVV